MSRWVGLWIVGVGVVHTIFGLVFQRRVLRELVDDGLFNTVNGQPEREFAFWFMFFGFLAIVLGFLIDWIERQGLRLPRYLGWSLLGLTGVLVFIMPISGGWLLAPPAIGAIVNTRRAVRGEWSADVTSRRTIGEDRLKRLPAFGARIYDRLVQIRPVTQQYGEIAQELASRISKGRLLDVGTGPGKLLLELHRINLEIRLYGLDLSPSMIQLAKRNLASIEVDLRLGTIADTPYVSDYFDAVTSTGSLYLWDKPEEGIEEIYRILKKGRSAFLYEPYKDVDIDRYSGALKVNLRQVNVLLRLVGPKILSNLLRMTYRVDEYHEIVQHTSFANNYTIERVVLGNLPMWVRIELAKRC